MKRPDGSLGLRARATIAWGVVALLLSSALATIAYQVVRNQLIAERQDTAISQAYLNARMIRNAVQAGEPSMNQAISSVVAGSRSAVLVRLGGEWFSGSVGIGPDDLPASLAEVVADDRAGRQLVTIQGRPFVGIGVAVPAFNARYFEFVPVDDIDRTLEGLARGLALSAMAATFGGAAIGWLVSGSILKPLRQFTSAAERVAEGSLDTRISATGDRDLRTLARSFNRMADAVQQRIDREKRFTSQVSHELRSPIAALFSTINVARRQRSAPKDPARTWDEIERRVRDLHRLVEDLLELSRVEAGVSGMQVETVDPVRLTRTLLERMDATSVPVEVGETVPPTIQADKRRLTQMLQNLLENADRYAGGATGIGISNGEGFVRFAVDDQGPGVAEHERTMIFERFARGEAALRSEASGSGLGLALVVEHAALHGGSVGLEERPEGGCRFVISLPIGGPV